MIKTCAKEIHCAIYQVWWNDSNDETIVFIYFTLSIIIIKDGVHILQLSFIAIYQVYEMIVFIYFTLSFIVISYPAGWCWSAIDYFFHFASIKDSWFMFNQHVNFKNSHFKLYLQWRTWSEDLCLEVKTCAWKCL